MDRIPNAHPGSLVLPFPSEHAARQSDPGKFARFRRLVPEGFPKGIEAIVGFFEDGGSEIQSLRFDAKIWTADKAKEWLKDHEFKTDLEEAAEKDDDGTAIRFDDLSEDGANVRTVHRWDLSELSESRITSSGFLRGEGFITRSGVFVYTLRDGTTRRELRPPDEVFKADSLDSFALAPLTLKHPPQNLTPETARDFSVGSIGVPERSGSFVKAPILITHKQAIEAVKGGTNKLSCGYTCQLIENAGTFVHADGKEERFDAIQTGILGNHVAIVDSSRAGPAAQIRIDEADGFADFTRKDKQTMELIEITINGRTYKVPKEAAEAMRADGVFDPPKPPEDDDEKRKLREELDTARGELAAFKAQDTEQKEEGAQNKMVRERIELIAQAAPILGKGVDELLELGAIEIMKATIAASAPEVKTDGESDDFIRGVFRSVTDRVDTAEKIRALVNKGREKKTDRKDGEDESKKKAEAARAKMIADMANAWKPKTLRQAETERDKA